MYAELIDRRQLKQRVREKCKTAQVPVLAFTGLYLGILLVLNLVSLTTTGGEGLLSTFSDILTGLIASVLFAGFLLYCMAIRRGERAEYLTLFDGFSLVGKLIVLTILQNCFIFFWSLLFVVPGVIAAYRYRFALYNLLENPDLSAFQALDLSKRQTTGYKAQLFLYDLSYLGWSLLAQLPSLYFGAQAAYAAASTLMGDAGGYASAGFLPLALTAAWSMIVQLFYLPQMVCGELAYFETAKRTSGTGVDNGPSDFDPPTIHVDRPGPDNMGGYNNPDTY